MIEISGDLLEGGGQVIRTSVALAALLGKDIRITKIRAKRPNPGLRAQHIVAVKSVAALSNAEVSGLEIGSPALEFKPRSRVSGLLKFDVGTAGSISLILQALLPAAAFASSEVALEVTGGTDVRWSPTIDYVRFVMLPLLEKMGYHASLTLIRRGHYPKGGGKVTITIKPCKCLMPITLLRQGEVVEVSGLSHSVRLPPHVAERQAKAAEEFLTRYKFPRPRIDLETFKASTDPHIAPGSGITLFARCSSNAILGADCVGERGKPAEQVGLEAAQKLLKEVKSNMPVDRHMGDMLVPYMAVADGLSTIAVSELTLHTLTNVKIAEIISGVKFEIEGELGNPGKLSVKGIGLKS